MLVYQKTMFGRYYCIKSFCHLTTLEKRFEKSFLYYYNGAQKHEGFVGLLRHPNVTELRSFLHSVAIIEFPNQLTRN